jgi:hypothetical protein
MSYHYWSAAPVCKLKSFDAQYGGFIESLRRHFDGMPDAVGILV